MRNTVCFDIVAFQCSICTQLSGNFFSKLPVVIASVDEMKANIEATQLVAVSNLLAQKSKARTPNPPSNITVNLTDDTDTSNCKRSTTSLSSPAPIDSQLYRWCSLVSELKARIIYLCKMRLSSLPLNSAPSNQIHPIKQMDY